MSRRPRCCQPPAAPAFLRCLRGDARHASCDGSRTDGTLGLAAACWGIAVGQVHGMDMGVAIRLGSLASVMAMWVAMMLPGAAPALRRTRASGGVRAVPPFIGSYLAVWALPGATVYALYRPHGPVAAGAVTIAAGVYEFTPLKRHFRRRSRDSVCSGLRFGLCCAGSTIGLMAMLVALDVMSAPGCR